MDSDGLAQGHGLRMQEGQGILPLEQFRHFDQGGCFLVQHSFQRGTVNLGDIDAQRPVVPGIEERVIIEAGLQDVSPLRQAIPVLVTIG